MKIGETIDEALSNELVIKRSQKIESKIIAMGFSQDFSFILGYFLGKAISRGAKKEELKQVISEQIDLLYLTIAGRVDEEPID